MIFFIQRVIQNLRPMNFDLSDDSQYLTEIVQMFLKSDILRQEGETLRQTMICWTPFPFTIILNGPAISFA